jgi:2-isopropylmalate synthase
MDKILILDTTLRDGEQSPGFSMTSEQKIEFARQLARLNVDVIEAGFPAASPDDFAAVQRIAREVKGPVITGLARCVPGDIDTLWEAVKVAETPRIHTFISTSDIHLERQFRLSREQAKERAVEMVKRAKGYCSDVEFSPMDATRSDWGYLYDVLEAVIQAGATTINVADTCGYSLPDEFEQMLRGIWERVPSAHKATLSVHCHNDLGLATANALTAVRAGARQVEVCVNGIGERAGNTALEEFVMAMNVRKDHVGPAGTTVNTREIYPTSQMLTEFTGESVQANKPIVGRNSFAHESGIHQDGVLKDKTTYEIMRPEEVGRHDDRLVLGKHSGRHALRVELAKLGYEMGTYDLLATFQRFKDVADTKKEVFPDDLHDIMRGHAEPAAADGNGQAQPAEAAHSHGHSHAHTR